jgi:hypothetical protein
MDYDSTLPLYSIHVPKCGGTSLRSTLESWFGERFFIHYFQTSNTPPARVEAAPGICVHGHFNRNKGIGLLDYYPAARQVITFLREPLDASISQYCFWRHTARPYQLKVGLLEEGSRSDFRDIEDFFRQRPRSDLLKFMPGEVTEGNYRDLIDRYFLFIGFVEEYEKSLDSLAGRLGFESRPAAHINRTQRNEELSRERREKFEGDNRLEYAVYRYALEKFGTLSA